MSITNRIHRILGNTKRSALFRMLAAHGANLMVNVAGPGLSVWETLNKLGIRARAVRVIGSVAPTDRLVGKTISRVIEAPSANGCLNQVYLVCTDGTEIAFGAYENHVVFVIVDPAVQGARMAHGPGDSEGDPATGGASVNAGGGR